jgi:putative hydrolase of the HAD superfamily
MSPQVVVFDLGKVLLDFDYRIVARKLAATSSAPPETIRAFIDQSTLLFRYETGAMTTKEFFEAVGAEAGFNGTLEEFTGIFGDIFTPIPAMIDLHGRLRERGIPTFIFSNTNELAIAHIRATYPFFHNFTDYVFSYEHGAMKPDTKLYEAVERMTGRSPGEMLYIDDRAENIEAGRQRGWHAVLHETPEATMAAVERAGLLR